VDKTKRPVMANIASTLSDKAIITSDNPRTEDPQSIIADMEKG
jgi:UDP-N-acetylmuramoyl-L-alanyl-D-glutamate--2,6-diaminopimelate ligase